MLSLGRWMICLAAAKLLALPATAQDMMQHVDLSSPAFSLAEMTRAEVEATLKAAPGGADLSGKSLNGLDLSGLDLHGVNFRAAKMNKAKLTGARLDGAILDQVWAIGADFSQASLKKANLFGSQMQEASCDGADFSGARVTADLSRASLRNANFSGADLAADMRNQSMGLMRAVLKSADLTGAVFENANLGSTDLQFAKFLGANFRGASLAGQRLPGPIFAVRFSITQISMEPMSPPPGLMPLRKEPSQTPRMSLKHSRNEPRKATNGGEAIDHGFCKSTA